MYFIRKWKVKIDAFETTELRVKFEVDKSLVGSPNLMKLEIYNIKESNRNLIKEVYQNIELYAGYEDSMPLIFKGQLRTVSHLLVGVDWITTIYAADGALALENAKINKTYPAGTTQETLVDSLIGELSSVGGIAKGKLEGIKECITKKKSLLKSMIMSGGVKEWLDELSKTCGFNYSVNDGVIDTNTKDKPLNDEPMFLISQKTGMIGSPEITEVGASVSVYLKGTVTGTVTDVDGFYSLAMPDSLDSVVLVYSFIGFKMQEVSFQRDSINRERFYILMNRENGQN